MKTPLCVLIVEDSAAEAELLLRELRRGGADVVSEVVRTAEAMRAALGRQAWDLVISDHALPGFDAMAALEVLHSTGQDLPFIIVAGGMSEDMALEAMKVGAHDYVLKDRLGRLLPVIERELREAVERRNRREAEQALRRSEATNRALLDAIPDLIFRIRRDGTFLGFKPAKDFETFVPPEVFLGRRFQEVLPAEQARFLAERIEHVLRTGESQATEYQLPVRGQLRDYEARIVLDTPEELLVIVRDISEQRHLREQLLQAQKMEAVGRLAGGVAHDFNNLLTVILGHGELLSQQLAGQEALRREADEIRRAAMRAAQLTQQLLAFSRKQVVTPRVLDVNAVIEGLGKMLPRLLGEDMELTLRLAPSLGRIRADAGQIEQVLMNLVVNARDAMPRGGRIVIETADTELGGSASPGDLPLPPGPYVMLAVSDDGSGMDPETQSRMFEPFFTTKEHGKGTGLGLSTVYGIVTHSGGGITVRSEIGKGTTLRIYLPCVAEAEARADPPPAEAGALRGTETVLLVEDEPLVRALVRDILSRHGYTVLETRTGTEALRRAEAHTGPIHLLVTDVVMPGLGGSEIARRLHALRPGLKVLYLSGYIDDTVLRHGVGGPGSGFLQKPFAPDALVRKVREVLEEPVGPVG